MNHQGLPWNVYCIATVVLRKQLTFKSVAIRCKRSCYNLGVAWRPHPRVASEWFSLVFLEQIILLHGGQQKPAWIFLLVCLFFLS